MSEVGALVSLEAEDALIGALVIDPRLLEEIDIEAEEIHDLRGQSILRALREIQARGELEEATVVTIAEELKQIDGINGISVFELAEYANRCPQTGGIGGYARVVRATAERRRLVDIAGKMASEAYKPDADISSIASKTIESLIKTGGRREGAVSVKRVSSELFDEVTAAHAQPRDYFGIPTGVSGFDMITSGMQRGEVTMLAGEPGVGKSSFAMQLCAGMARGAYGFAGTPGAVYQLEMSAIATWRRLVALKARVTSKNLRSGRLTDDELARFIEAQAELSELPIFISDRTDWTTVGLRSDISKLKAEHDIGWVLIDYLGLLKDEPHLDDTERSAIVSNRIHDIAKDFDVSVLALNDMTKAGMTGVVHGQAGLAGSRRVMYNADSIIFLKNEDGTNNNRYKLEWAKFREDSADRYLLLQRVKGQAAFTEI